MLRERLTFYGHRNWIVVADSAYPAQTSPGIETILSGANHFAVLNEVLSSISKSRHVRPIVFQDEELKFVPEEDAPGVQAYREQLAMLLNGLRDVNVQKHEDIIRKLDQTAQTFAVLIIKTTLTIPYTSVFFQLDCAYWSAASEKRLRTAMSR